MRELIHLDYIILDIVVSISTIRTKVLVLMKCMKVDKMCFDCCEVVVCCVNCMIVSINDLPIEIIEDFIFPLLTLKDIKNLGKIGIKRLEDIADKYIADNKCKSFSYS